MGSFVLLDVGRPAEIEATVDHQGVWVDPEDIEATLGWELKPEGLCKDAMCIPVTGHHGFARDGVIQLQALADVLGARSPCRSKRASPTWAHHWIFISGPSVSW